MVVVENKESRTMILKCYSTRSHDFRLWTDLEERFKHHYFTLILEPNTTWNTAQCKLYITHHWHLLDAHTCISMDHHISTKLVHNDNELKRGLRLVSILKYVFLFCILILYYGNYLCCQKNFRHVKILWSQKCHYVTIPNMAVWKHLVCLAPDVPDGWSFPDATFIVIHTIHTPSCRYTPYEVASHQSRGVHGAMREHLLGL